MEATTIATISFDSTNNSFNNSAFTILPSISKPIRGFVRFFLDDPHLRAKLRC